LIDFNRAGVPLMELVTEPVITSAKQAGDFARELQLILRYLGVSEANMEKGQMRVEANISIRLARSDSAESDLGPEGKPVLGTKVEVKNLNSFKSVEKAIDYELKRQAEAIEKGEAIVQSTRGWDEIKQETFLQRVKESSHDYRYFPDPDLPKLWVSQVAELQNLAETLPELPEAKRARYRADYGIKDEDIESYVTDENLGRYFDDLIKMLENDKNLAKLASNYITSDLIGLLSNLDARRPSAQNFAELIKMAAAAEISSRGAKDILAIMIKADGSPKQIAAEKGLLQQSDEGAIGAIVDKVIVANQSVFDEYRAGNDKLLQFLIGQAMKESKGSANPGVLAKLFGAKK
ncbi:MAG: Asp-tRNA(Asn)/Glu-tRNA(Gln) amidotransferase subunit GatB, partial [Candidatus Vogelbacteria bacterium]|nr:Asp-tRNA(Asn)/Glu-tRNA(Gln) amidotransferase subunit GatB [Candidatus Vogelbacteria bacterium]